MELGGGVPESKELDGLARLDELPRIGGRVLELEEKSGRELQSNSIS